MYFNPYYLFSLLFFSKKYYLIFLTYDKIISMKKMKYIYNQPIPKYLFGDEETIASSLFVDIETTGLSPKNSSIYLIGAAHYTNGQLEILQWFAETPEEEKDILIRFSDFIKDYKTLIHFNGNQFDIPFLQNRMLLHEMDDSFVEKEGIDLYKRVLPRKNFLKLPNCRQKTIEQFLGIQRKDTCSGGDLIPIYQQYCIHPSQEHLDMLLLHNKEDVLYLTQILPILAYNDLFQEAPTVIKVQERTYENMIGEEALEVFLTLKLPVDLPTPISVNAKDFYFTAQGNNGLLRVPVVQEELKYFYSNYKEYYYLPEEDVAIHKGLATFVDKEYRVQAKASTCYTRKQSSYIPQWEPCISPVFKKEYNSSALYFEWTDEITENKNQLNHYAAHVLSILATTE